jgi:hypothetical protein
VTPVPGAVYGFRRDSKGTTQAFTQSLRALSSRFEPAKVWEFDASRVVRVFADAAPTPLAPAYLGGETATPKAVVELPPQWNVPAAFGGGQNSARTYLGSAELALAVEDDPVVRDRVRGGAVRAQGCGSWIHAANILQFYSRKNPSTVFTYFACSTPVAVPSGGSFEVHFHINQCRSSCYDFVFDAAATRGDAPGSSSFLLTPWVSATCTAPGSRKFLAYAKVRRAPSGDGVLVYSVVTALRKKKFDMKRARGSGPCECAVCV